MHHSYLDKYARGRSPIHGLDGRTKLLSSGALVVLIAATNQPGTFFLGAVFILVVSVCFIARIPLRYLLTRSAIVIPFTGFAAFSYALTANQGHIVWHWGLFSLTSGGLRQALLLFARAWLAVSFMILLVNTTPFDRLLASLRSLRIPALFVLLLSFLYRYLYLLWDEAERLQRARNLRYYGGSWLRQIPVAGHLVSTLFLRSYERAERVQMAMTTRGWDGEIRFPASHSLPITDRLMLLAAAFLVGCLWWIRTL